MSYHIEASDWEQHKAALQAIRRQVFIEEQSVPEELEWDGEDEQAYHWLAWDDQGQAVGTVRLLRNGHIGRMAVLSSHRQEGIGYALLQAAISQARADQHFETYLYAQTHALAFYSRAGFIASEEEFLDAGIPHRTMRLQLAERRLLAVHGGNFAPASYRASCGELIRQTRKQLRILSFDLAPEIFERREILADLSALARKSRYSEIRILIVDTSKILSRGHRLLDLQRRLSSTIHIRRIRLEPHDVKENLLMADLDGIICQSIKEPEKVWANFNCRPVAQNYISQFDDWWQQAINDPNLRLLEI